jgi:transcription elongation GreA/GreB family factor
MELPDKAQVLEALIQHVTSSVAHAVHNAEEIRKDATHAEARPENDKDTRALEQTYLARGQAMRAEAMVEQLSLLRTLNVAPLREGEPIRSGALVALEDDAGERLLFMAPFGGGAQLAVGRHSIQVVTPVSAMGRALLGKREGDDIEVRVPTGARDYTVIAVR